jgi:hypothetical protein
MTAFAAYAYSHAGRLVPAFDEDEITLAWDAVDTAGLRPGSRIDPGTLDLPAWWWTGTGLLREAGCERRLGLAQSSLGPVACVLGPGQETDPEALANAALALATTVDADTLARIERARNGADLEADYPLGAHVAPQRHDEVLAQRMRMPPGRVLAWTTIGVGAAPSEFARLQDAVGAYHVVLVAIPEGRTVGIATSAQAPQVGQRVRPVLRRLFRQQGVWRYGVKFAPA